MSKVEIDKEDFLNLLNRIHKIAERAFLMKDLILTTGEKLNTWLRK